MPSGHRLTCFFKAEAGRFIILAAAAGRFITKQKNNVMNNIRLYCIILHYNIFDDIEETELGDIK